MSASAGIFVLLFLLGCGLALVRHPVFGVMTYVLLFYVSPADRWWGQGALEGMRWALAAALITAMSIAIHRPVRPAIPFAKQPLVWGFAAFTGWVAIQSFWALDQESHSDLLSYYLKYIVAMYLIYRSLDSETSIQRLLWAHVAGCTYLAWLAYTTHAGGRFDSFGGAGIGEANSGALTITTGILAAASLFLVGAKWSRVAVLGAMPLLVNAVVATISRSGFLAFGVAGLTYNLFAPKRYSKWVRVLSVVGLGLFLILTNPDYWERIRSLEHLGEQVEGVDTGSKRLVLIQAQFEMSRRFPQGCGSRCTDVLSTEYLDPRQLTHRPGEEPSRSSHNTFMTMLVDHGIPGAVAYALMTFWMLLALRQLRKVYMGEQGFMATMLPAVAGSLIAITIGDLFVQYPKLEVRFWLLTLVMTMSSMASVRRLETLTVKPEPENLGETRPIGGSAT